ncbi:MAG: hypothetical protein QM485_03675, partial [Flavobacteriaceae bacterium]
MYHFKDTRMNSFIGRTFKVTTLLFLFSTVVMAQNFDILIKGGHVIDAKNGIDKVIDIAIKEGKI